MRRITVLTTAVLCAAVLSACERGTSNEEIEEALKDVNVIDETNLNDVMLTVADPDEAVAYFARTSAANPERIELKRGLAVSLVRAGKPTMAATAWSEVLQM